MESGEIVLYSTEDGTVSIQLYSAGEISPFLLAGMDFFRHWRLLLKAVNLSYVAPFDSEGLDASLQ